MNRQLAAVGTVAVLIGFILGFFTARILNEPPSRDLASSEETMPENHPGLETMEQVREMSLKAGEEPENIEVRVELGNTFYDMGRYDVAERWYREALELDPGQPRVSTDLGTALLFLGRTEEAIAQYRQSLSVQPDHAQSLQNLGVALFSQEKFGEAIEVWQQLIEKHPDYEENSRIREQIRTAKERMSNPGGDSR